MTSARASGVGAGEPTASRALHREGPVSPSGLPCQPLCPRQFCTLGPPEADSFSPARSPKYHLLREAFPGRRLHLITQLFSAAGTLIWSYRRVYLSASPHVGCQQRDSRSLPGASSVLSPENLAGSSELFVEEGMEGGVEATEPP